MASTKMYFDEDFLENPSQPIKINGKYYDTEDVTDPGLWLLVVESFKDYAVEPMNANIDVPDIDPETDTERDTLEVFLLRIIELDNCLQLATFTILKMRLY